MGLQPRDITTYAYIPGSATQGDYYTTDDGLTTDTPSPLHHTPSFSRDIQMAKPWESTAEDTTPSCSLFSSLEEEVRGQGCLLLPLQEKSTRVSSLSTRRQKVKLSTLSIREQSSPLLLRKRRQSARSPFPLSRRNQRTTSPSSLYSP